MMEDTKRAALTREGDAMARDLLAYLGIGPEEATARGLPMTQAYDPESGAMGIEYGGTYYLRGDDGQIVPVPDGRLN